MKRVGLTHGGFYGHFASKDDLAAEMTARVLGRQGWMARLARTANPSFDAVARGYRTPQHRDNAGRGCLFAALASDVQRRPRPVRRAFTEGFRSRVEALRKLLPGRSAAAARQKALATMAGLVIVISDFYDAEDDTHRELKRLKNRK